jgi:NCS1 family nucleobase:cation symporter-1
LYEAPAHRPISGLPQALPSWVVTPYLIVAIVTLLAVNTIDLYSSGLTLQAMGLKIKRWQCVIVDMVIATIVTGITIFSSNFHRIYSDFPGLLIVWLSPWLAIYLVDWWLRRGRYDAPALLADRGGRYWRGNGFGPLSSRSVGSDFSFFMGLVVGGGLYYLLAQRSVAAEADLTEVASS